MIQRYQKLVEIVQLLTTQGRHPCASTRGCQRQCKGLKFLFGQYSIYLTVV